MIYAFLYLISLLPFRVLYFFSDLTSFILFYIIRYRRNVVEENIKKSFQNLNENDRLKIEREFYTNFCDNFFETIKLLSMTKNELHSRIEFDYSNLKQLIENKQNIHIYLGHQFNWEWANAHIASVLKNVNIVVAYKPLRNKSFNGFMLKLRSRFGSKMVSSKNMKKEIEDLKVNEHILIMVADQNPKTPDKSFWTSFLSRPTSFISGSELYSASKNTPTFFAKIVRIKRGKYKFEVSPIFNFDEEYHLGKITSIFTHKLEDAIIHNPENYLWSHKRWKHIYKEQYNKRWLTNLELTY
ncbi:lysophospholipid acyltransferase family protein [Flavobacterium terrae]|uniref:KDO2-lipid IV(A) lauroyltransferase n=1 Tax=Flavobacterium terrae TaxID=415425 RepID=A0A1M6ESL8_9FLAO|nr:lysophospholipid acyltransferase family protein [Flavobacterium terrae]SHI88501.1 KDO2-lipid IV(A) lauroyltransferase [Flavobacterium terrae]